MKLQCEIDRLNTLKNGMKIVLSLDDKETAKAMKDIHNFMSKPITVEMLIDSDEQLRRMKQISNEQRRKIFALVKDIAEYFGEDKEYTRKQVTNTFCKTNGYADFSLSDCQGDLASEFIEWLVQFCFEQGVALTESPIDGFDDVGRYLAMCLKNKVCCVCGKRPSDLHHWDAIGAGRDAKHYDDSKQRKIQLCREHHTECHTIGRDTFEGKYHVYGIVYNE